MEDGVEFCFKHEALVSKSDSTLSFLLSVLPPQQCHCCIYHATGEVIRESLYWLAGLIIMCVWVRSKLKAKQKKIDILNLSKPDHYTFKGNWELHATKQRRRSVIHGLVFPREFFVVVDSNYWWSKEAKEPKKQTKKHKQTNKKTPCRPCCCQ